MFHMGWFLSTGFGVYGWNTMWAGNIADDIAQPDLFVDMARSLERAKFDFMVLEDSSVVPDVFMGTMEHTLARGYVRHDPMPLIPLLAAATSRIGLIATAATTFYPPFLAARMLATLDHLTKGRVGVNIVTSSPDAAAQNYGLDNQIEHDLRYEMADEWMQLVTALWESWDPDAVVMDRDTGVFADHTKVHRIDFEGRFYRSRGPLNTVPSPQRRPVICQAGGSAAGREVASKHADTIIASVVGVEAMRAYRDDISARMIAHGRDPADVKVLFLVAPVLAETDAEAHDHLARQRAAQAADINGTLARLSYMSGTDFSRFDLDAPFPEVEVNGHQSTMADFKRAAIGKTLREVCQTRVVTESVELVGTPDTVAAQMEEAMSHAGGDGFLIAKPVTRKNITEIADGLAPALRRRGLMRSSYGHEHFRDNLLEF